MRWVALGRDRYRTTHDHQVWWLVATPGESKPWLLYTEREHGGRPVPDQTQEIGGQSADAAQHAAELWLSLTKMCGD
jgi:hypothetical protein